MIYRYASGIYEDEQEETLYSFVLKNTVAMSELAHGWVVRYQNDRDTALLELIQFFFNSSGCKALSRPIYTVVLAEVSKKC